MIDITGPKVLTPALIFAVLSPGILLAIPAGQSLLVQAATHSIVLALVYWAISKFIIKVSLTTADMIVPAILFVALTPGILLTLPPGSAGVFRSGQTSGSAVAVHTLVYAIVFATLRSVFPEYY